MTNPETKAEAQARFEADRAEKQQAHLAKCKVTDCRDCKIMRGEPLNDPPGPRCPTCNGYLGVVNVPLEDPISIKRAAWAYGCAKKGSPEELHARVAFVKALLAIGITLPSDGVE